MDRWSPLVAALLAAPLGAGAALAHGRLIDHGVRQGAEYKSYLMSARPNEIAGLHYVAGRFRVVVLGSRGKAEGVHHWDYRARCTTTPARQEQEPLGIFVKRVKGEPAEDFIEVVMPGSPSSADRNWYNLWWRVCRNERRFQGY
jgi:hypothetical protein